jgi:nitroreductase
MDFYDVVRRRRSIRKYAPENVPDDALKRVLEAARWAPSWANRQCCRYVVVDDPAIISVISGRSISFGAPVYVVACADPDKSGRKDGKDYYLVDVAISMEHLVLAAAAEGLGTCWLGGMLDEAIVKKQLGIPDNMRVVAMTSLGYPEKSALKGLAGEAMRKVIGADARKPLSDIVFKNKYGEPLK